MKFEEIQKFRRRSFWIFLGIRFGSKHGIAFNLSGFWRLQIILNDGKKILVGTQKTDDLKKFLSSMKP